MAVGTVTQSIAHYTTQPRGSGKGGFKVLTLACVGGTAGDAGVINDTNVEAKYMEQIKGCWLVKVQLVTGATGPTADSDVYIKDANSIDLLGGAGVDALDNAANTGVEVWPQITNLDSEHDVVMQPIIGDTLTLDVNGNSVASSVYSVILFFVADASGV